MAIKTGLEELKLKFRVVEDYLTLYSSKPKIAEAVRVLHISMLKGVEEVIGFYTRNIGKQLHRVQVVCAPGLTACYSHQRT